MATIFARLVIICKDFSTPCFTTFITGKKGLFKNSTLYWPVNMFFHNKKVCKIPKSHKILYLPFAKKKFEVGEWDSKKIRFRLKIKIYDFFIFCTNNCKFSFKNWVILPYSEWHSWGLVKKAFIAIMFLK